MCVQAGYNYEKAFQNTVQVCKQLMKQLGIPADRVVQHYDVCAKNCPSAIRAKGDWNRFKQLIGAETTTPTVDKYYRTRKSWADSKSQIGACKSLENAKKEWKQGYTKNTGVKVSGTCGIDSWKKMIEHMKANTHN